nr:unnamed protein product [Digitaria exilis]
MPELLLIRVTGAELLLLLLLPHATATIHATLSAMVGGDERALLDFKAKITSHSGALASWNTSNSYCDWEGVRCGRRHPQKVVALDLQSKGLVGTISPAIGNLTFLCLLNLSFNSFHGQIPPTIGYLRRLEVIYLRANFFAGTIPSNISNCTSLRQMLIGDNNMGMQGGIPAEIGSMASLTVLELPNNGFTGTIPSSLGNLSRLTALSLSGNYLQGSIPHRIGNNPSLQFLQLSRNNLSAVKVFNLQQPGSYKSFQAECEALRRVRHRCLVKVITSCASINHQGQDFRALVFEFMPNGSLDSWIHSDTESQSGRRALTLEQRLDIAVDIADAIDYLHTGCQTSIIHCDLKPGNILIAQDIRACVGDFGIARILNEAARTTSSHSNSIIGIRGSIGYVAPEYGEGLAVSTYGDVYSLGITLIDMFTGRSRTDDIFRDGLSLHYFAKAALPDKVMEIVDSRIWLHDEANKGNGTRDTTRTKECLAAVIQLGVMCSKQSPRERLLIRDAALEMRNIRNAYLSK